MSASQDVDRDADKSIPYRVNAEPQVTTAHQLTGREILERAGFVPPEDYKLTREHGDREIALDDRESIHKDEVFLATYRGVTGVS